VFRAGPITAHYKDRPSVKHRPSLRHRRYHGCPPSSSGKGLPEGQLGFAANTA